MDHPKDFRSTVLQAPSRHDDRDDDRDRDRRRHRDIMNPAPGSTRHSGFNLRSPTQSEYHHPPHSSYSSPKAASSTPHALPHHSPRSHQSGLSHPNPYSSSTAAGGPLAPSLPALGGASSSSGAGHHQAPPLSPLHPPSGYYPPPESHQTREKPATSSYYDPLTDTTRERRVSDAGWNNNAANGSPKTTRGDPYGNYSQPEPASRDSHAYYKNGSAGYTSPSAANFPPRSPRSHSHSHSNSHSHSHQPPTGSISPSIRATPHMTSPSLRHAASPSVHASSNGGAVASLPPLGKAEPSPLKAPASTPSRADPMSFSNILSSAEPVSKPKSKSPPPVEEKEKERENEKEKEKEKAVEPKTDREKPRSVDPPVKTERTERSEREAEIELRPEPVKERSSTPLARKERKERVPRKSKSRASDIRDAESTPKSSRRASSKLETPTPRIPSKRLANGQPKQKTLPADKEKKVTDLIAQLDADADELTDSELTADRAQYQESGNKRRRLLQDKDSKRNVERRDEFSREMGRRLGTHADLGKRRYDDIYYEEAMNEVRERELFAEKERKKDMQRKRRREKSMAVTMEQQKLALERARLAEDETEKAKHLRDAERANKKALQTKLILQKGIKGPARNLAELNLDGGTMATYQASDMEPGTKPKGKGRSGPRPKKSKEQKQAEKDAAEAAQAAIDAGEELPIKEEGKIRIKFNKKSKDKDKEKNKDKDVDQDEPDVEVEGEGDVDIDEDTIVEPVKEKKERKSKKEKKEKKEEKPEEPPNKDAKFETKGFLQIYDQIWRDLARKDVSKTYKMAAESYQTKASNLKKTAILASKEAKRWQLRTNKGTKDQQARAKRVMRDMMGFWKRNEREERDLRKAAEKQEIENARKEEAEREAARQKRKLNFLISQTELYSHFIGKKIKTDEVERSTDNPEIAAENKDETAHNKHLDIAEPTGPLGAKVTDFENLTFEEEDEENLRQAAMANAQNAIAEAQRKARAFNEPEGPDMDEEGEMNFQNPAGMGDVAIEQPKLINAQLKEYQLKGLNWLANLYEQGINGILADEMGLGKTVQSISVMAYLAEKYDIWGPFLVVAPASTLHNWEQEIRKFVPEFKILPYWGSAGDRKVLRKFWDRKHTTYKKDASFHVCVTSYQLVVSDVAYFQKMKWQYMILDEAQAIKSSQSSRWKSLLNFHCRNRLLLTGTPIQNNMQELWALLHFIMPSLFDSHDEFSEWFSKDIESHAQSNTKLNEDQLKRLHMILKPFMLRRVKKHVQKELGDKIEEDVYCDLTYRQRAIYSNLRNQISIMDLIEKATTGDNDDSGTLMNLVMQFRKVCNHPDLFERADTTSPFSFGYFAETASFVREGNNVAVGYSTRNLIEYELPRLLWRQDGRLYKADRGNLKAGWRNKNLQHMMNIFTPEHIRDSLEGSDAFSFLRFADTSPTEVYKASHEDVFSRAVELSQKKDRLPLMKIAYDDAEDANFTPAHALFKIAARNNRQPLADITQEGIMANLMNVAREEYVDSGLGRLEQAGRPRASAPPIEVSCCSSGTGLETESILFNRSMRKSLFGPTIQEERAMITEKLPFDRFPPRKLLPAPDNDKKKFNNIATPSMRRFVTDSGKLATLDKLLTKLKAEGHRVLLYFQMTRMIDLMEEYLTYRNYKYCRLDGSTKLEDRRDTVADFQTRPEIFIFLLSTRAGGLGINLTSADTVIFYDSDWNPTIDSQAMDRAHRLGQTRQVTVYRLITKGTIEERIRKRAMQKEEVQRVVIQGGGASVDFSGRRAPENRNRDIAMWLADDEQAEMIEQREKEMLQAGEFDKPEKKKKTTKRKRVVNEDVSLDEMYHEGEGNFDDNRNGANGTSGTATPVAEPEVKGTKKQRRGGGKKAKTLKQRLALADGQV
ncbi:SNF2 family domain-containing protein [Colletotrichum costaricense]|uniref:Chromatin-remodeling ATPase INO80 n=1 Tax=Colletotrichum costaricense TaxID=1209916 RepID=A0AAI9YVM4_9PEZI|nr:SNF2 family domain-containing protein [Colletotrichum costaricense]KAK1525883.1 SNF2 family domain-containing protein [Colletotrichum costaricense]